MGCDLWRRGFGNIGVDGRLSRAPQLSLETSYDRVRTSVIVSQTNWLGWDFGASVDELYAVELYLADYFPPSPPTPPSPPFPPPPSPPPPSPPPAFSPRPPPPPPTVDTTVFCSSQNTDLCVFENVIYHRDGQCDDGGPGSLSAMCTLGSDATDCGFRQDSNCADSVSVSTFTECIAQCMALPLQDLVSCDASCRNNPLFQPTSAAATSATAATTPVAAAAAVAIAVAAATAVAATAVATPIPSSKSATPESPAANQWLPSGVREWHLGILCRSCNRHERGQGGLVVLFVPSMLWVLCVVPPKLGIKVHYRAHPNIDNPLAFRSKAIVRRGL